jgi:hypothetical protein
MGANKSKSSEKISTDKKTSSKQALLASRIEAGSTEMEELLTGNYHPNFSFLRIFKSMVWSTL